VNPAPNLPKGGENHESWEVNLTWIFYFDPVVCWAVFPTGTPPMMPRCIFLCDIHGSRSSRLNNTMGWTGLDYRAEKHGCRGKIGDWAKNEKHWLK
jgi:hypothetical protein